MLILTARTQSKENGESVFPGEQSVGKHHHPVWAQPGLTAPPCPHLQLHILPYPGDLLPVCSWLLKGDVAPYQEFLEMTHLSLPLCLVSPFLFSVTAWSQVTVLSSTFTKYLFCLTPYIPDLLIFCNDWLRQGLLLSQTHTPAKLINSVNWSHGMPD